MTPSASCYFKAVRKLLKKSICPFSSKDTTPQTQEEFWALKNITMNKPRRYRRYNVAGKPTLKIT